MDLSVVTPVKIDNTISLPRMPTSTSKYVYGDKENDLSSESKSEYSSDVEVNTGQFVSRGQVSTFEFTARPLAP